MSVRVFPFTPARPKRTASAFETAADTAILREFFGDQTENLWTPGEIADLEAWWDFADASKRTLTNGRVSQITDSGPGGRTVA